MRTAEGVVGGQGPQSRGREEPSRAQLWSKGASPSDVRKGLRVELDGGGMSPRDSEQGVEKALGQFVRSKRTVRELRDTLPQEDEAVRPRALSGSAVAQLLIDAGYEPWRRWGTKTGVRGVGARWGEGRKGFLSLWTANRASQAGCLEGRRDLLKRGLQTPVPLTPAGAGGLTKAREASWPKSLGRRCGLHKMQNFQHKGPPQAWPEFKALVADRRDAPTGTEAARRRQLSVNRSQRDFPAACRGLLDEGEASLTQLSVPQRPQPYVRTSNLAERAFAEERRRPTVSPPWWEEGGVGTLVWAVLIRLSERWGKQCGREFEQHQIRSLRRRRKLDEHAGTSSPPTTEPQPRRSAASAA